MCRGRRLRLFFKIPHHAGKILKLTFKVLQTGPLGRIGSVPCCLKVQTHKVIGSRRHFADLIGLILKPVVGLQKSFLGVSLRWQKVQSHEVMKLKGKPDRVNDQALVFLLKIFGVNSVLFDLAKQGLLRNVRMKCSLIDSALKGLQGLHDELFFKGFLLCVEIKIFIDTCQG